MTTKELEALLVLGARTEPWKFNEVPEHVTLGLLRRLDEAGYVQVRPWHYQAVTNPDGTHGQRATSWGYGWVSPVGSPGSVGDWEQFYPRHRQEQPCWELRLSPRGRAEYERQIETIDNERANLNDAVWRKAIRTGRIANADLARLAGLEAEYVSEQVRDALEAAGQAIRPGARGIRREWSLGQLRKAYPFVTGTLRTWLELAGLNKPG